MGRDQAPRRHIPARAESTFEGLHLLAAGLFLAAGAEALAARRRSTIRLPAALEMAPVVAAPLAGVAHVARAVRPGPRTRAASNLLSGLAVGIGAAGVIAGVWAARREWEDLPSWGRSRLRSFGRRAEAVAPLTFGATGILGLVLDHEEQREAETVARLTRKASVVERLVPKRRAKLDRIVVHI